MRAGFRTRLLDLARSLTGAPRLRHPSSASLVSVLIIYVAAVPFAGWETPTAWAIAMSVLVAADAGWSTARRKRAGGRKVAENGAWQPFNWLLNAGFSLAALYLVFFHGGAAQTLGVTLYGVVMFQILARDYAAPKRLLINLLGPVLSMIAVQLAAAALLLHHGQPWQLITLVASPYFVFRAFRAVQHNLQLSHTRARDALAQAHESETRYRQLADRSPDVILRYDTEGRIEYASPAVRTYGYAPEAVVGQNVAHFLGPEDQAHQRQRLAGLAEGAEPDRGSDQAIWRTWRADGTPLVFEGGSSPIRDDEGRLIGAVAVLRDITERLELEDELRRKGRDAEAAAVAKAEFLANMSHEIRTPLTGVIGFAGLLGDMKDLPDEATRHVDRIQTGAKSLLAVVNDVLDFSKLEAHQVELAAHPFAPLAFLDETVDLVRELATRKGLALALEPAGTWPDQIRGDAGRIRQVLLNLLTNAVKFTDAGQVTVRATWTADVLTVAVDDTGVGVPEDLAPKLFQRFSQVDGSSARRHGGTGLGLAISKGLVEMMGGAIGVESRPTGGSRFWFEIPTPQSHEIPDSETVAGEASPAIGRPRLLVVDDVPVNRELVRAILKPFDLDIAEAASGAEAIDAAGRHGFDLILMDLQMPGMDGMDATAAIRRTCDLNRDTPILALSANVLPAEVEACHRAGMNDHIGKPIDPRDLLTKIARWTAPREPADPRLSHEAPRGETAKA